MRTIRRFVFLAALTSIYGIALVVLPTFAADAVFGVVGKTQNYEQVGTNIPTIKHYKFSVAVLETSDTPNSITGGSISGPNLPSTALINNYQNDGDIWWEYRNQYSSQQDLDTAYFDGTYSLNVTPRSDTGHTLSLNLTGDSYPASPYISNYAALSAANPSSGFTINWIPWVGGTTSDFIYVEIRDDANDNLLYSSTWPGQANTLNGTATSYAVPAGVVPSGNPFDVSVTFFHPVATDTTYPSVPFYAVYESSDGLVIGVPEPASLSLLALGGTVLLIRRRKTA